MRESRTTEQVSAELGKRVGVRECRSGLMRALIPQARRNPVRNQELGVSSTVALFIECGLAGRDLRPTLR